MREGVRDKTTVAFHVVELNLIIAFLYSAYSFMLCASMVVLQRAHMRHNDLSKGGALTRITTIKVKQLCPETLCIKERSTMAFAYPVHISQPNGRPSSQILLENAPVSSFACDSDNSSHRFDVLCPLVSVMMILSRRHVRL